MLRKVLNSVVLHGCPEKVVPRIGVASQSSQGASVGVVRPWSLRHASMMNFGHGDPSMPGTCVNSIESWLSMHSLRFSCTCVIMLRDRTMGTVWQYCRSDVILSITMFVKTSSTRVMSAWNWVLSKDEPSMDIDSQSSWTLSLIAYWN